MKTIDTPKKQNLTARERILLTATDLFYASVEFRVGTHHG